MWYCVNICGTFSIHVVQCQVNTWGTFDDQRLVEVTRLAVRLLLVVPKRRVFEEDVARDALEALSMPALAESRNPRVHCMSYEEEDT